MRRFLIPMVAGTSLLLSGCIQTAVGIVTAPVKVAGKAVDWTTTSQSESDRNYGKKMRKAEAREGRERKAHEEECRRHPNEPCRPYDGFRAHDRADR
ncbi:MAG: hypothetical protein WDN44_00410 [Sphingomonas sp.]